MPFPLTSYSATQGRTFAGVRQHNAGDRVRAMINKESAASMPFGRFVCYERSTNDAGALNPDATTDKLAGVTCHDYGYSEAQLGLGTAGAGTAEIGVLPTFGVNVLEHGAVWCPCEEDVLPGDPVFVRAVATGAEVEGAVRKSADSTDCIDLTGKAKFGSSRVNGLALVEIFAL